MVVGAMVMDATAIGSPPFPTTPNNRAASSRLWGGVKDALTETLRTPLAIRLGAGPAGRLTNRPSRPLQRLVRILPVAVGFEQAHIAPHVTGKFILSGALCASACHFSRPSLWSRSCTRVAHPQIGLNVSSLSASPTRLALRTCLPYLLAWPPTRLD